MSRPALAAVLLFATLARADELAAPRVERRTGLTLIEVEGQVGGAGPVEVGLAQEGRLLLRGALTGEGRVRGSISTGRLLLPGAYELRLLRGEAVLARRELILGDAGELEASRAREARWAAEATRAARGLCVALERNARFVAALGLARAEAARRCAVFLGAWRRQLRRSRAELALFERRVVAPHSPDAIAALGRLHAALAARAGVWERALSQGAPAPAGPDPAVDEAARALLQARGQPAQLDAWREGPLATPPVWDQVRAGETWRADGFELPIPAGFVCSEPPPRPEVRLQLRATERPVSITVTVGEDPELTDLAGLEAMHETSNWESYPGYAAPRVERPPEGGLTLRFRWDPAGAGAPADAARPTVEVAQRVLFAPERGRTLVLAVSWSGAEPPELAGLLRDFRVGD